MRVAWISDSRISALGARDRKLSGLYQSFTYVFDVCLVSEVSAREAVRAMFVNVEPLFSKPFLCLPADVTGLCDLRLSWREAGEGARARERGGKLRGSMQFLTRNGCPNKRNIIRGFGVDCEKE